MEVILKKSYKTLGNKGKIVNVKPGFGRNYLFPQGIAAVADKTGKKIALENQKQAEKKAVKLKYDAVEIVKLLENITLKVPAKAGDEGKIFGSVTSLQISKALKEKGIVVDYTLIHLAEPIKKIGGYAAVLMLHKEVTHNLIFQVIAS